MLLLKAQNISKSFGATQALSSVSINLKAGQVHALVGENGAGKSTLFKICAGAVQPDGGTMELDGKPYAPRTMRDAQRSGVALVFQEMTINPSLNVAENILIDRMWDHAGPLGLTRWRRLHAAAQGLLDEIGSGLSVEQNISDLDLGQLKVLEVARALSYRPRVLLLDESTAFLNTQEMSALFNVINNLRAQGIAIGYISHHLDEVERVADSITILKDGQWVGDYERAELTNEQIEARMVGREIGRGIYPEKPTLAPNGGGPLLALAQASVAGRLHNVSLDLYPGEIVGIGGLKGAGGESLLGVIAGDVALDGGRMALRGQPYSPRKPFDAWAQGIAYLPGDRTREGLIMDFSVQDNLSMAAIPRRGPLVNRAAERALVNRLIPLLQIKAASPAVAASSLSGGNLQKVVLGKCIASEPQVLLLDNPTRGIDVGARMQIYATIRDLAAAGVSVVLLSEDLPELIGMSDRIVLMRKGEISREFSHTEFPSEEEIIGYIV